MSLLKADRVLWQGQCWALVDFDGQLPLPEGAPFGPAQVLSLQIEEGKLFREGAEAVAYQGRLLLGQDDRPIAFRRYWTYTCLQELHFTAGVLTGVVDWSPLATRVRNRVETDADFAEKVWMRRDLPEELDTLWFS